MLFRILSLATMMTGSEVTPQAFCRKRLRPIYELNAVQDIWLDRPRIPLLFRTTVHGSLTATTQIVPTSQGAAYFRTH